MGPDAATFVYIILHAHLDLEIKPLLRYIGLHVCVCGAMRGGAVRGGASTQHEHMIA